MSKRALLGLLVSAGVVALVLFSVRERGAPLRSAPRSTPPTSDTTEQVTAGDVEADLGEGTLWGTVSVPPGTDVTTVRIFISTKLGVVRATNTGIANFNTSLEVGKDGTFRRDGLPLGEYQLVARHPSCSSCRMQFELHPGHATGPLHVLLAAGSILVRIAGPDGRRCGGESVALHRGEGTPEHIEYRLEPARPEVGTALTDADGEVRFANLESGTYTLTRRGPVVEQRSATVRPGEEAVVLFDASASLFGRLHGHDGLPIPAAKLFLTASGGRIYETRTDEGGAFAVRGIAAGEYGVTASVKGLGSVPLAETLSVEDGRTHERELRLPAIRLIGSVVEAESGAPFTSMGISLSAVAFDLDSRVFGRTGADGRFELAGLYPGRYAISADPEKTSEEGDVHASEIVTVTPTPGTQELVIRVKRVAKTARLRLTVSDRDGNPREDLLFVIDGRTGLQSKGGLLRCPDAKVVVPGVYDLLLVPGAHRILIRTQSSRADPFGRPYYYEELSLELETGQATERAIVLEKVVEAD